MAEIQTDVQLEGFAFSGGYSLPHVLTLTMRDATGERFDMNLSMTEELAGFLNLLTAKVNRTKRIPTVSAKVRITLELGDE